MLSDNLDGPLSLFVCYGERERKIKIKEWSEKVSDTGVRDNKEMRVPRGIRVKRHDTGENTLAEGAGKALV